MKNLVTAIDNEIINKKIKDSGKYNVVSKDITYKEGALEILEKEKIDILILKEKLPGEIEFKNLINKILEKEKNIELIIILENKNIELESYLYKKGIKNIFYNNQLITEKIINKIKIEEINNIKNIIFKNINNKKTINNKIISILGDSKFEKNIFITQLSNELKLNNKKILVFDLDILNPNINTIFGIKKFPDEFKNSEGEIKNKINKLYGNVDILSGLSFITNSNNCLFDIENIIDELEKHYDIILINNSSDCFFDLTKMIINKSNLSIFFTGTKIIQIKKSINLLKIYSKEFNISNEKIKIVYYRNKNEKNPKQILKKVFKNNKIIGSIIFNKNKENIFEENVGIILNNLNNKINYLKIKNKLRKAL